MVFCYFLFYSKGFMLLCLLHTSCLSSFSVLLWLPTCISISLYLYVFKSVCSLLWLPVRRATLCTVVLVFPSVLHVFVTVTCYCFSCFGLRLVT